MYNNFLYVYFNFQGFTSLQTLDVPVKKGHKITKAKDVSVALEVWREPLLCYKEMLAYCFKMLHFIEWSQDYLGFLLS